VHEPPRHVLGLVYPVSVDAAPLCFCDAAYDALGTETIAANAMAASTLIFEVMRIPPTRIVIIANGNVYAVAGPRCVPGFARAEISALLFAAAATAILAESLPKKQKLSQGNRRMANDDTSERSVLTECRASIRILVVRSQRQSSP
jgi:hypothetical protein